MDHFRLRWRDYEVGVVRDPTGKGVRLSRQQMEVLSIFVLRRALTIAELIEILYSDDPEGGPLAPRVVVSQVIAQINRAIRPWWTIRRQRGTIAHELARLRDYRRPALRPAIVESVSTPPPP
ncbi:hypothetical protein [Sphingomonas sp.]|uniref:hypothetical protein n=1 Tax=Sphingomonas sp. TaxID=28214 RepID=UPI003B3AC6F5